MRGGASVETKEASVMDHSLALIWKCSAYFCHTSCHSRA